MLPIVDKPLIQYAAEEALSAGARNLVFITGSSKRAIEDHFDSDRELEAALEAQGKHELLESLRGILPSWASCVYIRQPAPLGLGHAVLCARPVVGHEPFFVHLADDLIDAKVPCLRQMADIYEQHHGERARRPAGSAQRDRRYGIVASSACNGRLQPRRQIVEKPKPAAAPSTLAVVGRYILTPRIFEKLETTGRGAGGEIQLTDGIAALLAEEPVFATSSKGAATTAAASSAICRRRSNTR